MMNKYEFTGETKTIQLAFEFTGETKKFNLGDRTIVLQRIRADCRTVKDGKKAGDEE